MALAAQKTVLVRAPQPQVEMKDVSISADMKIWSWKMLLHDLNVSDKKTGLYQLEQHVSDWIPKRFPVPMALLNFGRFRGSEWIVRYIAAHEARAGHPRALLVVANNYAVGGMRKNNPLTIVSIGHRFKNNAGVDSVVAVQYDAVGDPHPCLLPYDGGWDERHYFLIEGKISVTPR